MSFQQYNKIRKSKTFSQKMNENMHDSVAVIHFECMKLEFFLSKKFNDGMPITKDNIGKINLKISSDLFKEFEDEYNINKPYSFNELKWFPNAEGVWEKSDIIFQRKRMPEYLTEISVPESFEDVFNPCFANFKSLKKVNYSDKIHHFGTLCFYNCANLKTFHISNHITKIDCCCFEDCRNLEEIIIPSSIEDLGSGAFSHCINLKYVSFNIPAISKLHLIPDDIFQNCINLKEIVIPNSITRIGSFAFDNCINLEKVFLSDNIWSIHESFIHCKKLTEIEFPKTLKKLNEYSFASCIHLKKITLHSCIYADWKSFVKNTTHLWDKEEHFTAGIDFENDVEDEESKKPIIFNIPKGIKQFYENALNSIPNVHVNYF